MKKFCKFLPYALGIVLTVSTLCAFAAQYTKFSSKFIKSFKDCDRYEESVTSEFEGKTFVTNRRIAGWQNGMCKYQETITSPEDKYTLNCLFSALQVDELYEAMTSKSKETEKYELDVFAKQKDPKTGEQKYVTIGSTTIIGNKAYVKWAKYQNNPHFCIPQKLSN